MKWADNLDFKPTLRCCHIQERKKVIVVKPKTKPEVEPRRRLDVNNENFLAAPAAKPAHM